MAKPRRKNQETSLSKAIRGALIARGAKVTRIQSGIIPALYGTTKRFIHCADPGTPDLLVMSWPLGKGSKPRFTWIEVKTATGKLSAEQKLWHEKMRALHVRVFIVHSIKEALGVVFDSDSAIGLAS